MLDLNNEKYNIHQEYNEFEMEKQEIEWHEEKQ